ncbi:MAG: arginine--tRNA ligase [Elusimicrobiota bacterium]|jgi:arginyl-tRNA synthetase|nr:arginine--tRNA ligase [Elusimicrobiota bacterium]
MFKHLLSQKLKEIIDKFLADKNINEKILWSLDVPPKNFQADFALNAAMPIAKKIKANPNLIAQELIGIILQEIPQIKTASIAGAGFINIIIKDEVLYNEVADILRLKKDYGKVYAKDTERVLIEFVSANPTGPLHIGHGRGAAIGDSLARIFEHLGLKVSREYYLNDAGNQMLILGESLKARYLELKGSKAEFPANHYQGSYIIDIAKKLVDTQKSIDEIDFTAEGVKDILKTIEDDLADFGVKFDTWFSESDLAITKDKNGDTEVDKVCKYLKDEGSAYIKDSALWLASTKYKDDKDRVLKRSDGRYTYLASDIAYHKNKYERGFDKLINLLGADHHGYVARLKAAVHLLGFNEISLNVILYQLVSLIRAGQPVAMSTRSGEFITLKEVVEDVGKDACRFFFLLRSPDSQLEFDLDIAKKQSSINPVFYVQYVNARCHSIIRESLKRKDLTLTPDLSLLKQKEERDLIKKLAQFCDILLICQKTLSPHHFTTYLIELADLFHKFYESCRVLTSDSSLSSARLGLIKAVTVIIENGLDLLGVSAPKAMQSK